MRYCFVLISALFFFCRAKKPAGIQLPKYHFIDHRIEILEQKDNFNEVKLYEKASARYSPFPAVVPQ